MSYSISGTYGPEFTQSGTGAVGRWLNDKVKEVISVKDFGAVGDGATQFTINTNVTPTTNCTIGYMIDCEL